MRRAVPLLLIGAVFALAPVLAQKAREDVRAEAASAAHAGQIDRGEVRSAPPDASSAPVKSRAEVRAEAASALGMRKPEIPTDATRK